MEEYTLGNPNYNNVDHGIFNHSFTFNVIVFLIELLFASFTLDAGFGNMIKNQIIYNIKRSLFITPRSQDNTGRSEFKVEETMFIISKDGTTSFQN